LKKELLHGKLMGTRGNNGWSRSRGGKILAVHHEKRQRGTKTGGVGRKLSVPRRVRTPESVLLEKHFIVGVSAARWKTCCGKMGASRIGLARSGVYQGRTCTSVWKRKRGGGEFTDPPW